MIIRIETERPMISLLLYLFSSLVPSSEEMVAFFTSLVAVGLKLTVLVQLMPASLSSTSVAEGIGVISVCDDVTAAGGDGVGDGVDVTADDDGVGDGVGDGVDIAVGDEVDVAVVDDGVGDGMGNRISILATTGCSMKSTIYTITGLLLLIYCSTYYGNITCHQLPYRTKHSRGSFHGF